MTNTCKGGYHALNQEGCEHGDPPGHLPEPMDSTEPKIPYSTTQCKPIPDPVEAPLRAVNGSVSLVSGDTSCSSHAPTNVMTILSKHPWSTIAIILV